MRGRDEATMLEGVMTDEGDEVRLRDLEARLLTRRTR